MKKLMLLVLCLVSLSAYAKIYEVNNQADFQRYVLESSIPVFIDVYSETCQPCKRMMPLFEKIAKQYDGTVQCVKICIQKTNIWAELTQQGAIRKVPTFIAWYKGSEVLPRLTGEIALPIFNAHVAQLIELANTQE